jgi:hypothetical protein
VAECWWFIPVILATREAEIRRITIGNLPGANSLGQIVRETLSQKKKKNHRKGLMEWLKM